MFFLCGKRFCVTFFLAFLLSVLCSVSAEPLRGVVRDSANKETLPFVSVFWAENEIVGTSSDDNGNYEIERCEGCKTLVFSSVGFNTKRYYVKPDRAVLNAYISSEEYQLETFYVKKKRRKERYVRKNNPAVMLMDSVISHKKYNDIREGESYVATRYEKTLLGINNIGEKSGGQEKRKLDFLYSSMDTSELSGNPYLPFSLRESFAEVHVDNDKKDSRTVVRSQNSKLLFNVISDELIDNVLRETFADVKVYDNSIDLLLTRFISPLSSLATTFYRFYIIDTIKTEDQTVIKMGFAPLNSKDMGFTGNMLIQKDSSFSVKEITLNVPQNSKMNFVKELRIVQQFDKLSNGKWGIAKEVMSGEISLIDQLQGGYARRTTYFGNYRFENPDSAVFANKDKVVMDIREDFNISSIRPDSLGNESNIDSLYSKLNDMWQFRVLEFTLRSIVEGYIPVGKPPKIDIGPLLTFLSFNELEGVRLGIGGVTDPGLHKRLFFSGFGAYGFKDEKVKYDAEVEYSFIDKKVARTEFPRKSVIVGCSYDWDIPSERFKESGKHNLLSSFKRVKVDRLAYVETQKVAFIDELYNGLSFSASLTHKTEEPAGLLVYRKNLSKDFVDEIETTEFSASVGFSPGRVYCQNRQFRGSLSKDKPRLEFVYTGAYKGFLNNEYNYNKTELSFEQRFFLTPFGKLNLFAKTGVIWDKVPYPLLFMPAVNLSYMIRSETFWLMNNMEFLSDKYATLDLMLDLDGFLLSRIPLIRELDLRELVRFKAFYGLLSDKNNPYVNSGDDVLFEFPNVDGSPASFMIDKDRPYMEVGVGLHNIFKIIQIEYVRRLNYLNNPGVDKWGIRFGFSLYF